MAWVTSVSQHRAEYGLTMPFLCQPTILVDTRSLLLVQKGHWWSTAVWKWLGSVIHTIVRKDSRHVKTGGNHTCSSNTQLVGNVSLFVFCALLEFGYLQIQIKYWSALRQAIHGYASHVVIVGRQRCASKSVHFKLTCRHHMVIPQSCQLQNTLHWLRWAHYIGCNYASKGSLFSVYMSACRPAARGKCLLYSASYMKQVYCMWA